MVHPTHECYILMQLLWSSNFSERAQVHGTAMRKAFSAAHNDHHIALDPAVKKRPRRRGKSLYNTGLQWIHNYIPT